MSSQADQPSQRYVSEALEQRRLLAAFLVLGGSQTPTPGATVNVSSDAANNQSEMLIVVNPTNPLNLVGFSHRLATPITLDLYRSVDGGSTWSTTLIDNNDDGQGTTGNRYDPAIAFDANGTLYMVYGYRGTTPDRLIAATSTDGGATFGGFQVLDSQNSFTPTGGNQLPGVDRWTLATGRVAGTNNQCAVIAYTQNGQEGGTNTDQRIALIGTQNGGANWTAPLVINDGSISGADAGNLGASPSIGFDGDLHVSWWDGGTTISIDHDRDGLFANTFNFGADGVVRTNQGLVNIGNPPTTPGPPAQPTRGLKMNPVLVAHPNITGESYITFQERFGTTGNDTDIWFGRSTDFGVNWTFSGVETANSTDFHPMIAVDRHSNMIGIAYYTTDGDQGSGNDDVRMRLAVSHDFGASWGKANVSAQQSNEAGGYGGDYLEYTGLALRDGTAQVLWASRYPLPVPPGGNSTELDAFTASVSFNSPSSINRLDIVGVPTAANNTYVIRRSSVNNQFLEVLTDGVRDYTGLIASIDSISIAANGGNDTFRFENLPSIPVTIEGTVGNDGFNIDFLSGASSLTINGYAGNDTVTLGTGVSDFLTINSPVSFFGHEGSDTLNQGFGNADAINASVSFDGGGGGGVDSVEVNDGGATSNVEFDITPNTVIRHSLIPPSTLSYSNTETINIYAGAFNDSFVVRNGVSASVACYGNFGNDNFTFGDGLLAPLAGVVFNGLSGNDTLNFDDHNNPAGRVWDIFNDRVVFAGAFVFLTTGFEGIGILAGMGGDTIRFSNQVFSQAYTVDGGGNYDDVMINGARIASITARGGAGGDHLYIDDRSTTTNMTGGDIYADRVVHGAFGGEQFTVYYSGFSAVDWYLQLQQNGVDVWGVSPDIDPASAFFINGNNSDDFVNVHPHDAAGNVTINGNVYFTPGAGSGVIDELWISDNVSSVPGGATYRVYNQFGPGTAATIGIPGNRWVAATPSVETIKLFGTTGADIFNVEQLTSGSALHIYGNDGNDNCTIGNGDMSANLTNATAFTFDGGANSDRFAIANGLTTSAWSYGVNTNTVSASIPGVYSWTSTVLAIESQYIFAGSGPDLFGAPAILPGRYTEFNGFAGYDSVQLGLNFASLHLEQIQSPIVFNAGADGGRASIDDAADTTADVAHLTENTLGAFAGDSLFGPGGSFTFSGLTNSGGSDGLSILLGQAGDTLYAQPLASARVTVSGGLPNSSPGDSLNLAIAALSSPSVSGSAASGNLTSGNRQTLSWDTFEGSIATDAVAPAVIAAEIKVDGAPGFAFGPGGPQVVEVRFSENVSGLLNPSWLQLLNLTTSQVVPAGAIAVNYVAGTNTAQFSFPGYANGVLPDGNYQGKILAGLPDLFGNGLPADAPFLFFFLNADANRDRRVNTLDFNLLAANFGAGGKVFSQGDFNYDATVDSADFNMLIAQYGKSLPAPASASSPQPFFSTFRSAAGDEDLWQSAT